MPPDQVTTPEPAVSAPPQVAAPPVSAQTPSPQPSAAPSAVPAPSSTPAATPTPPDWGQFVAGASHFAPELAQRYQNNGEQLARDLLVAARERAELARQYQEAREQLSHYEWLRQQQSQPTPAPQVPARKYPEFDRRWLEGVSRDPQTGALSVLPGYPPDLIHRLRAATEHREQVADWLAFQPEKALEHLGFADSVKKIVEEQVRQHLSGYQDQQLASQYVQQSQGWMYQQDPLTGRTVLSPWGQRFQHYVNQLTQAGMADTGLQAQVAQAMTERDYLRSQQPAQTNQQQKDQFVQNNNRPAPANPAAPAVAPAPAPRRKGGDTQRELERRMVERMQAEGRMLDTVVPG